MAGTVDVGCKLAAGLYLQLDKLEDHNEAVVGGGVKVVQRAVPSGPKIKINGAARYINKDTMHDIRDGAGITYNVDADFFNEWMKRNVDMDLVRNKLIFAQSKAGEVRAQARDHRVLLTGLEPVDPNNLPAEFKGKISTADESGK